MATTYAEALLELYTCVTEMQGYCNKIIPIIISCLPSLLRQSSHRCGCWTSVMKEHVVEVECKSLYFSRSLNVLRVEKKRNGACRKTNKIRSNISKMKNEKQDKFG